MKPSAKLHLYESYWLAERVDKNLVFTLTIEMQLIGSYSSWANTHNIFPKINSANLILYPYNPVCSNSTSIHSSALLFKVN